MSKVEYQINYYMDGIGLQIEVFTDVEEAINRFGELRENGLDVDLFKNEFSSTHMTVDCDGIYATPETEAAEMQRQGVTL